MYFSNHGVPKNNDFVMSRRTTIQSVDCGSLWAVVDHVQRVGVPVLDCCPEADSDLLCWANEKKPLNDISCATELGSSR